MVQHELPSFNRASDIAEVLLKAAMEVTTKKEKYSTKHFYKLCKGIECLEHPIRVEYDRKASVENVEVFSSFRPSVSATFSAEKLEQVTLSSESDSEPEETGRSSHSLDDYIEVLSDAPAGSENPRSDNNLTNEIDNDFSPPAPGKTPPVQTSPTVSNFWRVGKPTKREGTVLCPLQHGHGFVKYSNISKHQENTHG